jgi:hypothetical protein
MVRWPVTTLIAVYTSSGCVGRCDAKCYLAAEDECDCICQGRNHGAGLQNAIENTRELAQSWLDRARAGNPDIDGTELADAITHEPLFALPGMADDPARGPGRHPTG